MRDKALGVHVRVKTPGLITHEKALVDVADGAARFLDMVACPAERLGFSF